MDIINNLFTSQYLQTFGICDWAYSEEAKAISFDHYQQWVKQDGHGMLGYLADYRKNVRTSLSQFYPDFQSALVFLFDYKNYKNIVRQESSNGLNMASYALAFEGADYHHVLKQRLVKIAAQIKQEMAAQGIDLEFTVSLDVHPVLERDLAFRAGLGWFGKNSMLISKKHGSYFLIAAILFNQKLSVQSKLLDSDHCGTCTACIDSCPTAAIDGETRTLTADKCISTYTIELFKDQLPPPQGMHLGDGEIFGCDICQQVCPWNNKQSDQDAPNLAQAQNSLLDFFFRKPLPILLEELNNMSNQSFKRKFKNTAFERTGRVGILKNILAWSKWWSNKS